MTNMDKLYEAVAARGPVCVGLDTDFSYLPADFVDTTLTKGENIVRFNKKLIDATKAMAGCNKEQNAYYESLSLEDMKAYAEAKGRIFKQDTVRVVNREDAETLRLAQGGPVRTFGGGAPVKAGEYGLARGADGLLWLSRIDEGASEPTLFCPEKSLLIAGRHTAMNALAALALIEAAGLPVGPALAALAASGREPHRLERELA